MSRNQPPQPCSQESQFAPHPSKLLGVGIAAGLDCGTLGDANIRLPQRNVALLGRLAEFHDRPKVQLRVGRMSDVLLLHRCVDVHVLQFSWRHLLFTDGQGDRLLQSVLEASPRRLVYAI